MSKAPPDSSQLAGELKGLLRRGVTAAALADCPALLSLAVVAAKAAGQSTADLAVAA